MKTTKSALLIAAAGIAFGAASAPTQSRAEEGALKNRSIGYVMTNKNIATWQSSDGKTECPNGINDGPREQFKTLYPDDGTKRTFVETQLEREGQIWNPTTEPESSKLVFHEVAGNTGIGLNLDGKVGPKDFTSPDGEKGIDNQIYRVVGCIGNYRGPDGSYRHFVEEYMQKFNYNRTLIELTEVDSLANDPDVTVTLYRGKDALTMDATGAYTAGGTQRVDMRWGKEFIYKLKGKIVDGVLTTTPADVTYPESQARGVPMEYVHDWRVRLKLSEEGAIGLMAGYIDIERFYNSLGQNWSTHHRSYGMEAMPSEYRSLRRNADAYPDKDGNNTAISGAWEVRFSQAFIMHPDATVAQKDQPAKTTDIAR